MAKVVTALAPMISALNRRVPRTVGVFMVFSSSEIKLWDGRTGIHDGRGCMLATSQSMALCGTQGVPPGQESVTPLTARHATWALVCLTKSTMIYKILPGRVDLGGT